LDKNQKEKSWFQKMSAEVGLDFEEDEKEMTQQEINV